MTPDAVAQIGRALYGERWQTSLATDLQIADRTMRRWLAAESAIPGTVEKDLRNLLIERLKRLGGMIGYSVNAADRTVVHYPTASCFRYDDAGRLTLLNPQVLDEADVRLVTQGAAEALRQEAERNPEVRLVWLAQAGRQIPDISSMEIQTAKALRFAQKLSDTAIDLVGGSHIELTRKWARDPKVVALSILCRTICNFRGAILLVQQESIVEARALVRLIYENLLWISALRERGEAFVDDMLADEAFNRKALGQLTLHMGVKHGGDKNGADALKLRSLVSEIGKQFPSMKKLNAKETASAGPAELAYVEYARLSLDAVHCSITALGRHLSSEKSREKTELVLSVVPQTPSVELIATIVHACNGLFGVALGTNEMLGFTAESDNLGKLLIEFEGSIWAQDALHWKDAEDQEP